jgi:mono/diheme cytochrome c family protein
MRSLSILSVIFLTVWACSGPQPQEAENLDEKPADALYKTHCSICHGDDGRKGLAGARILPESKLSLDERVALITKGKGNMMAYEGLLNAKQIEAIAQYTMTL